VGLGKSGRDMICVSGDIDIDTYHGEGLVLLG
jgi:hypothetical protein